MYSVDSNPDRDIIPSFRFSEANTITVYILSVLITAIATSNRIYSLVSSILSVLIFNFMFTNPRFTLAAYGSGYPVTFAIMLIAALLQYFSNKG
ncbi:MAG: DUF4118 domain-containing protein [Thomasclavelia ramosa]